MKKTFFFLAALMASAVMMAQTPTVSASSVTFKYCMTSYGTINKSISMSEFPYTWTPAEGQSVVCGAPGTYVTTIKNARGCDSILTLNLEGFHGFSVSSTQSVQFSKGNLQFQGSTKTWRFAPNQYSYVGNVSANSNPQENQSAWMDLFCYGTIETPWKCGEYDYTWKNLIGKDYGSNVIDGYPAGTWRMLTYSEWSYLCTGSKRTGLYLSSSNIYITLEDNSKVYGIILLPDDWDKSTTPSFPITVAQWKTMEANGAVFLPKAGYRRYGSVSYVGSDPYYWAISPASNSYVTCPVFTSSGTMSNDVDMHQGYSVRLVHDSNK